MGVKSLRASVQANNAYSSEQRLHRSRQQLSPKHNVMMPIQIAHVGVLPFFGASVCTNVPELQPKLQPATVAEASTGWLTRTYIKLW